MKQRQMSSQIKDTIVDQALELSVVHTRLALVYTQKDHSLIRSMNHLSTYAGAWLDA